jgi:hypothetical protein
VADVMDLNIPLGRGTGIREIDGTKQQTLRHKRPWPRRRPKEKEEKHEDAAGWSAEPQGGEGRLTGADHNKADKALQPRGSILDVTI